jgi:DNA-binding PadR family transcriptional regulator
MMVARIGAQKGRRGAQTGELTKADLIVLSLLAERPMNGYELIGEYERQEVADWASVSKAQVYYAIQKLESLSLVASSLQKPSAGSRDRTIYGPTKQGGTELSKALVNENWAKVRVAQPFSTWLGLSIHVSATEKRKVLQAREDFIKGEIDRERASLIFIKTLNSARAKVGYEIVGLVIRQFEVELEWIGELLGASKTPKV